MTVPDGWSCSRHLRLTGSLKGKAYTQYHDPQGTILRSKEGARKRLGLPRKLKRKAVQSGIPNTVAAEDKSSQQVSSHVVQCKTTVKATCYSSVLQVLKQTKQGKVVKAGSSASCLLADLTDADLPPHLLQASPIYITIYNKPQVCRHAAMPLYIFDTI